MYCPPTWDSEHSGKCTVDLAHSLTLGRVVGHMPHGTRDSRWLDNSSVFAGPHAFSSTFVPRPRVSKRPVVCKQLPKRLITVVIRNDGVKGIKSGAALRYSRSRVHASVQVLQYSKVSRPKLCACFSSCRIAAETPANSHRSQTYRETKRKDPIQLSKCSGLVYTLDRATRLHDPRDLSACSKSASIA